MNLLPNQAWAASSAASLAEVSTATDSFDYVNLGASLNKDKICQQIITYFISLSNHLQQHIYQLSMTDEIGVAVTNHSCFKLAIFGFEIEKETQR